MNDRQGQEIEVVTRDGEIVSGLPQGYESTDEVTQTLAVALTRAEIEQQIVTARAMPRSITRAVENIIGLATLDEESAEECIYALPRAGKAIKGPSIRLAEVIQSCWGNCRSGTRVVHVDRFEKYVEAEGIFHDLETNSSSTARVRRRISDKRGKLLSEDMIIVTGNAACAIAKRNAILAGVPKAVWRKAYAEVERVIAGDVQTLVSRRDRALLKFARYGVVPEQVFAALGVPGVDDIKVEHLPTLTGMFAALKSGEANVEEMFPKVSDIAGAKTIGDKLDALAANGNGSGPREGVTLEGGADPANGVQPSGTVSQTAPKSEVTGSAGQAGTATAPSPAAATAEKRTRKASAKAEEAAGAQPAQAGAQPSPQADASAPAPNTETAKADSPPAVAESAAAATPPAAAAAPKAMTEAHKTGLRRMHKDIFTLAMGQKKARHIFEEFSKANELNEGDAAYVAGEAILLEHCKRLAGDGSPALCDAALNKAVA